MKIGELAKQTGTTRKALRYYEEVGLLEAGRLPNGYRDYDERDVRLVREVRALSTLGIGAENAKPFVECLISGRDRGDDCAAPLAIYRSTLNDLDERIAALSERRNAIADILSDAEARA